MTDLKHQLSRLLDDEPEAPYDIDIIVRAGRRRQWRHNAALAAAGTVGAAGVTAAVVLPVMATGGHGTPATLRVRSSPSPTAKAVDCYVISASPKAAKRDIVRLVRSGKLAEPSIRRVKSGKHSGRSVMEVCSRGMSPAGPAQGGRKKAQPADGPPYHYTEQPQAISSRLGAELHDRVRGLGLAITWTRAFSQESSTLEAGRPSYFDGNVDVHETTGYADIGVQVTHAVTGLVPFTGECTVAQHCTETTLDDGSVLRTGQVDAGQGDVVLTAELHRPDGVVVQAQESDYPFGPDAGSQPHGDQPLTADQLVALAEDAAFTF